MGDDLLNSKLKAILSLFVCISILISLAGPAVYSAEAPLSLWVAADTHYRPLGMLGPIEAESGLPGDPLYWHANTQGELVYESDAIMNELLARFELSGVSTLIIPGDLTCSGRLGEHRALADKFARFEARTGKSIFVINGNHDVRGLSGGDSIDLAIFKTLYADFGYNEALAQDNASGCYTAALGNGYRLIAIDSCIYGEDAGEINTARLAWVEAQTALAKADGVKLIGMMHHSILPHFGVQGLVGDTVKDYRILSCKFADWGIQIVFTGHKHANDITQAVSAAGNRIVDIETTSLISYPNSYRCVRFSNTAVQVETHNIDHINTAHLAPGYNAAQLALLQNDFPAFSQGYFYAAMRRWINEYIGTPRKIANLLKVEPGTAGYDALSLVMGVLGDALKLPIYDTTGSPAIDSVAEIAASVGESIESSSYTNFADLVGFFVSGMFCGDENTPYDSPEVRIFLQTFKAALVYALVQIPTDATRALLASLGLPGAAMPANEGSYTAAAKLIFAKTAASKILAVILKPLIEGITVDAFSPADLNVTLAGYGLAGSALETGGPITDFQLFVDIIRRLFLMVVDLVKVFSAV